MMTIQRQKNQNGFTIITVLLLILMANIIVIHSLKDSIVQERLSGNFQKKINARLLSEKGVFDAHDSINQLISTNPNKTITELINLSNNGSLSGQGTLADSKYQVSLIELASGELQVTSIGERFEGKNTLTANFNFISGGGSSPFNEAVVGCDGVTLNGSGTIDSYDSSKGNYSRSIAENEGDVYTVNPNSDIDLNGHSPIYGDVQSTGKVNLGGSSPVYGNIYATGDVYINQSSVEGYVLTAGGYEQKGGTVTEYVRANEFAKMGWGAKIQNINNFGLDILYGGADTFKDTTNNSHYGQTQYQVNPNIAPVPEYDPSSPDHDPKDPATNCDPININNEVAALDAGASLLGNLSVGATQSYTLTPYEGKYTANGSGLLSPVSSSLFNSTANVFKIANFKLNSDATMEITGGDVILYVKGDFDMAGNAKLTIDADSSLTIIVTGKLSVAGSAQIIATQHGLTSTSQPVLSIYSSNTNINGISISGSSDIYAAIYAPFTDVKVVGSGTIYGSVRAKTVTVSGGGGVHFDQALINAQNGSLSAGGSRLVLTSLKYF